MLYLAFLCPYTLIEDEAHYWEWSRRLEWSYYSKGPGIAWLIAAATRTLGDSEFAVRVFAPISSAVCGLFVSLLARAVASDSHPGPPAERDAFGWRTGLYALALFSLLPLYQTTSILMTIDMPYCACWAAACYAAWHALRARSRAAWLGVGLAIGVGFLFKYTILLLVPGILVPLTSAALRRGQCQPPQTPDKPLWPWLLGALALALTGLLPPILWNSQHEWVTVRHLLGHLGLSGGDVEATQGVKGWRYDPRWTLDFLGTQLGMLGPAAALIAASLLQRRDPSSSSRLPLSFAAPILCFYLAVSFVTEPEGNWAMAGYLSLLAPASVLLVRGLDDWRRRLAAWRALSAPRPKQGVLTRRPETFTQVVWHLTLAYGLIAGLGILRVDLFDRALAALGSSEQSRRVIPIGRLMGADKQAAHAARLLDQLASERAAAPGTAPGTTPPRPFILAQHYGRASQLAFYLPGRPRYTVYCSSAFMHGRRTQYDIWPETNLADPGTLASLMGRDAVVVGATQGEWEQAFARVEPLGSLEGDRKKGRPAFLGHDFRGFLLP